MPGDASSVVDLDTSLLEEKQNQHTIQSAKKKPSVGTGFES